MKIYQVVGKSDVHPDYSEWVVASYKFQEYAERHANFLDKFYKMVQKASNEAADRENLLCVALRDNHPFDPNFVDHGSVAYVVEPKEVLGSVPPSLVDVVSAFKTYQANVLKTAEKA